jgi:hypothetical protein
VSRGRPELRRAELGSGAESLHSPCRRRSETARHSRPEVSRGSRPRPQGNSHSRQSSTSPSAGDFLLGIAEGFVGLVLVVHLQLSLQWVMGSECRQRNRNSDWARRNTRKSLISRVSVHRTIPTRIPSYDFRASGEAATTIQDVVEKQVFADCPDRGTTELWREVGDGVTG